MKKRKAIDLNNAPAFSAWDIPVYAITLIVVALLFLFFVILPTPNANEGFSLFVDGKKIANYKYGEYSVQILDDAFQTNVVYDKTQSTITIYLSSDKVDYNVLKIDERDKTVKVIDANCSVSKDCVYTPSLKSGSAIVCAPHKLKILPLGESLSYPPVTGGVR